MPKVNIKNLKKFYNKYGEFPKAQFQSICGLAYGHGRLAGFYFSSYLDENKIPWEKCKITDKLWTKKNLKKEERKKK